MVHPGADGGATRRQFPDDGASVVHTEQEEGPTRGVELGVGEERGQGSHTEKPMSGWRPLPASWPPAMPARRRWCWAPSAGAATGSCSGSLWSTRSTGRTERPAWAGPPTRPTPATAGPRNRARRRGRPRARFPGHPDRGLTVAGTRGGSCSSGDGEVAWPRSGYEVQRRPTLDRLSDSFDSDSRATGEQAPEISWIGREHDPYPSIRGVGGDDGVDSARRTTSRGTGCGVAQCAGVTG